MDDYRISRRRRLLSAAALGLSSFKDFPPRQTAASLSIDQMMEKLQPKY